MAELARLAAITENFGGVRALRGVNFEVQTGEVHALVGENGAGKSTPMRVLGGEMTPSSGEVSIDGEHVDFRGPREARAHGIAIIHQELALAPDLSVAENIFLGELSGVISWSTLRRRASELSASLGFDIDPSLRAGALTVAHQQVVEIAKALSRKIKIIVFDDRRADARRGCRREERDLGIILKLAEEGKAVLVISSEHQELFGLCDRIDGRGAIARRTDAGGL